MPLHGGDAKGGHERPLPNIAAVYPEAGACLESLGSISLHLQSLVFIPSGNEIIAEIVWGLSLNASMAIGKAVTAGGSSAEAVHQAQMAAVAAVTSLEILVRWVLSTPCHVLHFDVPPPTSSSSSPSSATVEGGGKGAASDMPRRNRNNSFTFPDASTENSSSSSSNHHLHSSRNTRYRKGGVYRMPGEQVGNGGWNDGSRAHVSQMVFKAVQEGLQCVHTREVRLHNNTTSPPLRRALRTIQAFPLPTLGPAMLNTGTQEDGWNPLSSPRRSISSSQQQ
eukprot:jgi/Bigna1/66464/fgenesh1_pg.1_\